MKKLFGWVVMATSMLFFAACETEVVVTRPPEVVYVRPVAPGPDYIWIEGDWIWEGSRYHWHEGHWDHRVPDRTWRGGHWEEHKGGYKWSKGHWE
jgi:hypothetical protein